jgi:hypothetical protein
MPALDELLDWLGKRAGKRVYIEVGMHDPTMENATFHPVNLHTVLHEVVPGTDEGHDRHVYSLRFGGDNDRIYLDPETISEVEMHEVGPRVTFHDTFFIAFAG